jgi:glycosyltransferase involved in cell wall biosynthesis
VKVVAVTTSHRGDDARIVHRQARVLLEAGHSVTLISPDPDAAGALDPTGLVRHVVRRAVGRRRLAAWRAARRAVKQVSLDADVIVVHDLELVPVLTLSMRADAVVVWDVHEDYRAMAREAVWIPAPVRLLVVGVVAAVEWWTKRRCRLIVAEHGYAMRFGGAPVVPNTTWVGDEPISVPVDAPVVYVGRVSLDRGAADMIALGEALRERGGPRVVIVGPADAECEHMVREAAQRGAVEWCGPLPNPEAMKIVRGALVGLSLLRDTPNYRVSRPTKILEYLAAGVPTISTPLPQAAEVIDKSGSGTITLAWEGDQLVREVVDAVMAYASSPDRRRRESVSGWTYVRNHESWNIDGLRFVATLEGFVNDVR